MAVQVVPTANPLESVGTIFGPIANGLVVAVFTIFMLVSREDLRNRLIKLAGGTRLNPVTKALDETAQRINRYLLLQLLVNAAYGGVIGGVLYVTGIPNAALWGVAASVLRFLPYVGAPLAAIMPILLSLAVFPGWWHALATVGLYLVLELLAANVVEPLLYGSHVGLSPLAILVSAVFWTLIWGFPGLILATPLTVCLVVLGRHSRRLSFLNVLLGDEPVLAPHIQYYQRLLAADQNEAGQVLEQHLKEHSLEETYSSVLFPALSLAEQDRHRREFDEDTEIFLYQTTRELIEEYGELNDEPSQELSEPVLSDQLASRKRIGVLCVPAKDQADEIAALMLCQLLEQEGFSGQYLAVESPQATLQEINAAQPQIVCISALPPFALAQAKALYLKVRHAMPDVQVVICLWLFEGDIKKTEDRFRLDKRDHLMTTLPDVMAHLRATADPSLK
jgi:hypothetical protein